MLLFLVAAKLQVPKTLDGGSTQNLDTSATVNKARFQHLLFPALWCNLQNQGNLASDFHIITRHFTKENDLAGNFSKVMPSFMGRTK
ncbi:hypothetical protein Y1Q_0010135 [Alligator mississippiensis]|uniref:Uncharacterized protein n=1 Tax=Alligator mississippiensis TaxID=8496 RepID=A0A151NFX4_ALLMI|nr:hypothetical protein Y1Q_0010135 [Alligator mississippiensis]